MIKTLLIAPYQGLAETAKKVDTPEDIDLDVTIANLEEGVKVAKLAEKQGYELIISRGGTATMIQDEVSIPVVHIDITGYDMLRVFTLIRGIKKGVALVGYANISQGAATICNILEFDVKMITIKSRTEVRGHLEELKQQGFAVVIGDVITVQVAEQVGLRGVLITSGKEAVTDAFEEGIRVYNFFRRVNSQFYYFQETFNSMPFPVILLNKNADVIEKNLMYEQDIQCHEILESPVISKVIKRVLENETNQWTEVEGENTIYELQAFMVSKSEGIAGINIHASVLKSDNRAVRLIGAPVHIPIIGESDEAKRLRNNIQQFAHADELVSIIGESGTGKYTVAQEIHFEKFGQGYPMVVLEGSHLTSGDKIQAKLTAIKHGTVVIKDIESLSAEMQDTIKNLLRNIPNTMQVIVLANESLDQLVDNKALDKELYQKISDHVIHLSPLRERKEDIGVFVDYFLAEFHAENGFETIGMKQDAIEYLLQFEWLGNLSQLKKIIRELSTMTTANYIELFHVKELMNKYKQMSMVNDKKLQLDGTLEEIEQQVIRQVLEEEGNNQSKAAKRLNINRSTLWRKLKQ
ncbi:sigma-54-dependent Fis family transcriptional regulator [Virgibacillus salinus]|uniref:DNA-binding transcriptional response regulator, NtrC family, contains REC, AAA-type ATPase, and a Fis-type DNA-binding domains n=1 Tax=Virgibacillus salinus TaxID=553311 RepID=A0A1H0YRQ8_9BACI|nr:sigma-54-dependent transcriptional regulator [Virgibacillus salinus]SDQ17907.1 DNA-binding transcriptional response regulator, NtrC family, contains REC, AAA-type ATPase, and a Fis-type DNA-binding domains [Virgibacillus salinus]